MTSCVKRFLGRNMFNTVMSRHIGNADPASAMFWNFAVACFKLRYVTPSGNGK